MNPQYPCFSLTDDADVPQAFSDVADRIDLLESTNQIPTSTADSLRAIQSTLQIGYGAVDAQLSPFLARLPSGTGTAVVSYANAGRVLEYGGEVGLGWRLTDEWRFDLAYGLFEFSVKEAPVSDLTPNSPTHRGSVSMGYQGRQGFDGMVTFRFSSGHQWTAGVFDGWVPARQTFDLSLGYAINNNVRVFALGTNILDQERFQMFGGSVIGRRIMAGATANF